MGSVKRVPYIPMKKICLMGRQSCYRVLSKRFDLAPFKRNDTNNHLINFVFLSGFLLPLKQNFYIFLLIKNERSQLLKYYEYCLNMNKVMTARKLNKNIFEISFSLVTGDKRLPYYITNDIC